MGDRQTFQVMPSVAAASDRGPGRPGLGVQPRERDREAATTTASRSTTATGPRSRRPTTRRCCGSPSRQTRQLVFDNVNNYGGLTLDTGHGVRSPAAPTCKSGLSAGAGPDVRVRAWSTRRSPRSGMLPDGGRLQVRVLLASTPDVKTVHDADRDLADQRRAGEEEPGPGDPRAAPRWRRCATRARALWDKKLRGDRGRGRDRGPADHALLQPVPAVSSTRTRLREHRHRRPARSYATPSPVVADRPGRTPRHGPARKIVAGKVYVNNGFWDTYRTAWPAYSLLTPSTARRDGERVRAAVRGRRLDLALVLAGLREPDGRHQLGRRVRRRVPEGRAGASTCRRRTTRR